MIFPLQEDVIGMQGSVVLEYDLGLLLELAILFRGLNVCFVSHHLFPFLMQLLQAAETISDLPTGVPPVAAPILLHSAVLT